MAQTHTQFPLQFCGKPIKEFALNYYSVIRARRRINTKNFKTAHIHYKMVDINGMEWYGTVGALKKIVHLLPDSE